MNLIGSINLIPYRIMSHKLVAGKVLKSANEQERESLKRKLEKGIDSILAFLSDMRCHWSLVKEHDPLYVLKAPL